MVLGDIGGALKALTPGTHAVLVYDNQERKEEVMFTHLKLGDRKDGLVYVCSDETPAEARARMDAFGLETTPRIEDGTLEVRNYDEVYIVDGKVDTAGIIRSFSNRAYGCAVRGQNMRASAEMSAFFQERRVPELVEYEQALHRRFSFPAMGLCGYDLMKMYSSGSMESLWPILRAHALVIMTGPRGAFALEPEKVTQEGVARTMGMEVPPPTV